MLQHRRNPTARITVYIPQRDREDNIELRWSDGSGISSTACLAGPRDLPGVTCVTGRYLAIGPSVHNPRGYESNPRLRCLKSMPVVNQTASSSPRSGSSAWSPLL